MTIADDVPAVHLALLVWVAQRMVGRRRNDLGPFLAFGVLIAVVLGRRDLVDGPAVGDRVCIGVCDVFDDLGLGRTAGHPRPPRVSTARGACAWEASSRCARGRR